MMQTIVCGSLVCNRYLSSAKQAKVMQAVYATTIEQAFGQIIRELRRDRGLSQEELGFESGLHRTYVSLLERGKKSPTLTTLLQVGAALDIAPSEIVRRVENRIQWSTAKRGFREG
jgi:DNA-binding XRE family transcriptional regulator